MDMKQMVAGAKGMQDKGMEGDHQAKMAKMMEMMTQMRSMMDEMMAMMGSDGKRAGFESVDQG